MNRGFTLVEVAIVLVILGLLTGGILGGQSLIKAAQLRSVGTDYTRYVGAVSTFRDKFSALPGDMTNATSYWGLDAGGCPGTSATSPNPGKPTCNGDGNGQIYHTSATANEIYRAWQHLANAGLIEGSYTGVTNDAATYNLLRPSATTPNVPASRLPDVFWQPIYWGTVPISGTAAFDGDYEHVFNVGTGNNSNQPFLIPQDAWNIDTKLDDGKPGTGKVISPKTAAQANSVTGCSNIDYTVATSIAAASEYLLTNTAVACSFRMKMGL